MMTVRRPLAHAPDPSTSMLVILGTPVMRGRRRQKNTSSTFTAGSARRALPAREMLVRHTPFCLRCASVGRGLHVCSSGSTQCVLPSLAVNFAVRASAVHAVPTLVAWQSTQIHRPVMRTFLQHLLRTRPHSSCPH